jgi:hypothetical protein
MHKGYDLAFVAPVLGIRKEATTGHMPDFREARLFYCGS